MQSPSGRMEIIAGVQEYDVAANWKLMVENSVDDYHLPSTHSTWLNFMANSGVKIEPPKEEGLVLPTRDASRAVDVVSNLLNPMQKADFVAANSTEQQRVRIQHEVIGEQSGEREHQDDRGPALPADRFDEGIGGIDTDDHHHEDEQHHDGTGIDDDLHHSEERSLQRHVQNGEVDHRQCNE